MAIHSVQKLTTENIEIKSALIEVKALVIGKKQVTLSVFRQIPQEALFDAEGISLNGVPWGRVQYYWGDMDSDSIHVLWQKGTELRRDLVRYRENVKKHIRDNFILTNMTFQEKYRNDLTLLTYLHDCPNPIDHRYLCWDERDWDNLVGGDPCTCKLTVPKAPAQVRKPYGQEEKDEKAMEAYAIYRQDLNNYKAALNDWALYHRRMMGDVAMKAYANYKAKLDKHNQLIDAIIQTDQLFIAV